MIRRIGAIAVSACLALSPVSAQTSNCQWLGSIWTCTQTPTAQNNGPDWRILQQQRDAQTANPYEAFMRGQEARRAADAQAKVEREAQQSSKDDWDVRALRSAVGDLVASGDCPGAERLALSKGNFELAEQVKRYCAIPAKAQ